MTHYWKMELHVTGPTKTIYEVEREIVVNRQTMSDSSADKYFKDRLERN